MALKWDSDRLGMSLEHRQVCLQSSKCRVAQVVGKDGDDACFGECAGGVGNYSLAAVGCVLRGFTCAGGLLEGGAAAEEAAAVAGLPSAAGRAHSMG